MPRILLFSDLHAHNFQYKATYIDCPKDSVDNVQYTNLNSRLVDTILTIREIRDAAVEQEVDLVLFGGDLFHTRGAVDSDVVSVITNELAKFNKLELPLYILQGNHDFADRSGNVTSVDFLDHIPGVSLLKPGWNMIQDDLRVYAVPYVQDLSDDSVLQELTTVTSSDKCVQILLGHVGIQGAKVGSDYVLVSNTDIDFDKLNTKAFHASFFGHFHKHQKLGKNAWYIGATHEHNWGDADQHKTRGYLVANVTTMQCTVKFTPTVTAPRFVKVRTTKDLKKVRPNDFVRVMCPTTGCEPDLNTKLVAAVSKVSSHVEALEEAVVVDAALPKELFDPLAMVQEWVTLQGEGDPELLSLGSQLVTEVLGDEL